MTSRPSTRWGFQPNIEPGRAKFRSHRKFGRPYHCVLHSLVWSLKVLTNVDNMLLGNQNPEFSDHQSDEAINLSYH